MLFALPYYWNLLMVLGLMFEIPASELIISQGKSTIEIMAHTPGLPPSVLEETKKTVGVLEEILLKKKEEANKKENTESK
ncbi:MAG: hypothetical protein J6328_04035 [Bacilli bacterium]|nr:hypothetical protein [Bacilli bacterium]